MAKLNSFEEKIILKLIKKQEWLRNIENTTHLLPEISKDEKRASIIISCAYHI